MNNNIDLKKTEKMGYINFWCQKVIPLVFDDSLSYYEAICKFMQKLNEVISALNNNAQCIDELQGKYIILQRNFDALEVKWEEFKIYIENKFNTFKTEITTKEENFENTINNEFTSFKNYVENYLNNIDVQSYVNIKIDELAESGYFSTLLTNLGFNPDNYLAKNNTTVYVPTNDYNPATKKYVDEHSSQGVVYSAGNGIKIENDTISSENYYLKNITLNLQDKTNNDGIYCNGNTIILGSGNSNLADYLVGNVKVLGKDNKWGNGSSNSCILGNNNNISGDNNKAVVIVGRDNYTDKEDILLGEGLRNITINGAKSIIMGSYNDYNFTGKNIIIGNGIDNSNRHNAIVIPKGTSAPININQEVNCDNNFITRTYVVGDNVDTIYAEKPNALVNASEVKASFDPLQNSFDELNHNIIYGELPVTFESNITGNGGVIFNAISGSPIILCIKFTHPGKTAESADTEFKVGTIDLSTINMNKDYLPRYINAFVNSYPCVISLRTTNNENIYDIYYDGNAIPQSTGATNFIVKFNQIIGFMN